MFGRVFQEDVFWVTLWKFHRGCCYCSVAAVHTPFVRVTLGWRWQWLTAWPLWSGNPLPRVTSMWPLARPVQRSRHPVGVDLIAVVYADSFSLFFFFFYLPSMWLPCLYFWLGSFFFLKSHIHPLKFSFNFLFFTPAFFLSALHHGLVSFTLWPISQTGFASVWHLNGWRGVCGRSGGAWRG